MITRQIRLVMYCIIKLLYRLNDNLVIITIFFHKNKPAYADLSFYYLNFAITVSAGSNIASISLLFSFTQFLCCSDSI